MPRTRGKINSKNVLLALLFASLIAIILPRGLTGRLISSVEVLVPFQDWMTRASDATADALTPGDGGPVPRAKYDELQRRRDALEHNLAAACARLSRLEEDYAQVAGVRRRGLVDGRLIPARIVAFDSLNWRRSRLINAGALSGVRSSAAVASHYFTVEPVTPDGAADGAAVLAGEVLVGFVEQVGAHAARVRMLTDPQTRMPVLIARPNDDKLAPLDAEFWLVGTGGPLLEVHDVDHRYITSGSIKVGDAVLSVDHDPRLPVPMTVGTIIETRRDSDNSLLYVLTVKPPVDIDSLRSVLVVDTGHAAEQ